MVKAYQCDRCGKLYKKDVTYKPKFTINLYSYNMDLCPDCHEKLKEFVIKGGFYDEGSDQND